MYPSLPLAQLARLALALLVTNPVLVLALPTEEIRSPRTDTGGVPSGYTAGQLRVTGEVNGVTVNNTGTVQEIFAQLDAEKNDFKLSDLSFIESLSLIPNELHTRTMTDVNCLPVAGQNCKGADEPSINMGIFFLRNGGLTCNIGPRSCVRLSCSWDGGIHFYNNGDNEIRPSCKTVGAYAQALHDKCTRKKGIFRHDTVGGQVWDIENWNVFIRKDNC